MSMETKVMIECPSCGEKFETIRWKSLNAQLNPKEKEQLISGSIFHVTCTKCNEGFPIQYSMLYNDMTNKVMIQLALNENDEEEFKKSIKEMELRLPSMLSIAPQYRIVKNQNDLREKAMIFDCGLDDRVIELLKVY